MVKGNSKVSTTVALISRRKALSSPCSKLVIKIMRQVVARDAEVFTLDCTLHMSKSNTIVSEIKLCIETADKHITKDPQRAGWWRNIETQETTDAESFSHLCYGQHVIFTLQTERMTVDSEVDGRQCWNLLAVDHVLPLHQWYSTNLRIDLLH